MQITQLNELIYIYQETEFERIDEDTLKVSVFVKGCPIGQPLELFYFKH